MRELERASGVGRETIRYYIREGLLPEPRRESRNSAVYSDVHLLRLKTIKRLQEERYLPLAVIRTLLDAEQGEALRTTDAFPQLDRLLAARVRGTGEDDEALSLADLVQRLELEPGFAEGHVETGMISIGKDGLVSPADARLLATLKRLSDAGFGSQNGFFPKDLSFLVELMDWVVGQEVRLFFGHLAGQLPENEAADMAMNGIALINEVMAQLHVRAALRQLGESTPARPAALQS